MTRVRSLVACLVMPMLGCADVAGLDDLEIKRDTGAVDTNQRPPCDAASMPSPACDPGMVAVPGGCLTVAGTTELVSVAPFCVDITEVTVTAYVACVKAGNCAPPPATVTRDWTIVDDRVWRAESARCNINIAGNTDHPLNCIDARAAETHCASRGARLPSDAEWEWMVHGGPADSVFPWGNAAATDQPCWGHDQTCPVASSKDVGPLGIFDLAGNVAEWTSTTVQAERLARGGDFAATFRAELTGARRLPAEQRSNVVGFRCAK